MKIVYMYMLKTGGGKNMFLKKGVIWKRYGDKSILYDSQNDKTLELNGSATRILRETLVHRNSFNKIAMNLQIENPDCEYEDLLEDVKQCNEMLKSSGFFVERAEEASNLSLIGSFVSLETVSAEITTACNLHCRHCYQGEHSDNVKMMKMSEIEMMAKKIGELGVLAIVLTGGEPFLYPKLPEIVKIFNEENIRVHIFTNGQCTDENIIKKFVGLNVLFRISLEGHNAKLNDFMRGVGAFQTAFVFANICQKYHIDIGYSFTVSNRNYMFFDEMLYFAENMGAREIEMSEILDIRKDRDLSEFVLNEEQSRKFRVDTLQGFAKSKAFRKGMGLYRPSRNTSHLCSAGVTNIFVGVDGNIYPCNLFKDYKRYCAGNIFHDDLLQIWRKSTVFNELRNLNKKDLKDCEKCKASKNCNGGCRGRVLIAKGDIRASMDTVFCKVTSSLVEDISIANREVVR